VKFLTNGLDAKAMIFYITDYITKNELSCYHTLSLIKAAYEKIEDNKYPTAPNSNFTLTENRARRALFTCLNKLDTEVERSAQFVSTVLLDLELEFSSHKFRNFSVNSFVHKVIAANMPEQDGGAPVPEREEISIPVIPDRTALQQDNDTYPPLATVNQVIDYEFRTSLATDRTYKSLAEFPFAHDDDPRGYETNDIELAQMSPYDYSRCVTKQKLSQEQLLLEDVSFVDLRVNEHLYADGHPQAKTHIQTIHDRSNPHKTHPIPVMVQYTVPSEDSDREKHYAAILALLTPWTDPATICTPLPDDSNPEPERMSYEEAFILYMQDLTHFHPLKADRVREIRQNLESIRQGKEQQKKDRLAREKLAVEQDLVPNKPDGPMDFDGDEALEKDTFEGALHLDTVQEFRQNLPNGPRMHEKYREIVRVFEKDVGHPQIAAMDDYPPTVTGNGEMEAHTLDRINIESTHFKEALEEVQASQAQRADSSAINSFMLDPLQIAGKMNLSEQQTDVYLLILSQILRVRLFDLGQIKEKPKQMVLFLGGEGGTGKSVVVKALTKTLDDLHLRHTLRLAAFTGVAAANIGGCTVHTLLKINPHKPNAKQNLITKKLLGNVESVFIDEVSMISCTLMQKINVGLKFAKGNEEVFGGLTMIFAGDFYQLPPTCGRPLYSEQRVAGENNDTEEEAPTKALAGYNAFKKITDTFVLRTQYRIVDLDYLSIVHRFRLGSPYNNDTSNYLEKRRITEHNTLSQGKMSNATVLHDPIILVATNEARSNFNFIKARQVATIKKQKILLCMAHDTSTELFDRGLRKEAILQYGNGKTKYLDGCLPMFPGMPVLIKKNVAPELGVSNGSTGKIYRIDLHPNEVVDYSNTSVPHYLSYHPLAVYIKIDTKDNQILFTLPGLPPNVFPTSTMPGFDGCSSGHYNSSFTLGKEGIPIRRTQFIFSPGFAITVYASQGRTLTEALLYFGSKDDKNKAKLFQSAAVYVMLSRVCTGDNLGILGIVPHSTLIGLSPNATMLEYVKRNLHSKEKATLLKAKKGRKSILTLFNLMRQTQLP
jgi:hypothetical protein